MQAPDPASACLADETLVALLGKRLDAAQLLVAERHIAGCADCRRVLADAAYGAFVSTDRALRSHAEPRREPGALAHFELDPLEMYPLPELGSVLSEKYRLEALVGRGGMGVLFSARHVELGQRVAIKLMNHRGPHAGERFLREARIHARLSSPHIPRIHDLGRLPSGAPYIVMEFLEGEDLGRVIARGPLALADALDYVQQACAALREAHAAGIVHRDLKPANLFLVAGDGGTARLKLLDFGISKYLLEDSAEVQGFTATHSVLGSPLYMSPEQLLDSKNVDARTDVWSLGVLLYQLVTGKVPFEAASLPALCVAISSAVPPPPSTLRPELPGSLDAIVLHCLEKRREDRISSVDELARALIALRSPAALGAARVAPIEARRSLAVLGFDDLLALGAETWLSAALVQLFSAALMGQSELRLVAAERVAQTRRDLRLGVLEYANPDALRKLDLALRVDYVLFGSFLRTGPATAPQRLKLQVLVKAVRDGETLLTCVEEGQESDLYEMTERAAARLRDRLGLTRPSDALGVAQLLPQSAAAARHYAEGLLELYRLRPAKALPLLTAAAELEPEAPLVHIALARAADAAGRDEQARAFAERALGLSGVLSREARLALKAQYHATRREWAQAIAQYQALFTLYPDELDYGVQLARLQMFAGKPEASLTTIEALRELPSEISSDPRIDLEEARSAHGISDYGRCLAAARRAAVTGTARENWALVARAQYFIGLSLIHFGQTEVALAELDRGRELAILGEDLVFLGYLQPVIAFQYLTRGELGRARAALESAAVVVADVGNDYTAANISESLARLDREQGQHASARARVLAVLPHYRLDGSVHALSTAFTHLAALDADAGELDLAEQHVQQALDFSRQLGRKLAEADAVALQAVLARRRGRLALAATLEEQGLALAQATGNRRRIAHALESSGERLLGLADTAGARARLEQALALRREEGDLLGQRQTENLLLRVLTVEGQRGAGARAGELRQELEAIGAVALATKLRVTEIDAHTLAGHSPLALALAPEVSARSSDALGLDLALEVRAALAAAALAAGQAHAEAELCAVISEALAVGLEERAAWTVSQGLLAAASAPSGPPARELLGHRQRSRALGFLFRGLK